MVLTRLLWWLVAVLALGLAVLGVILPGLPTTPFVLVAAWAASRGSPRLDAWLERHRLFGPMISSWRDGGRIPRRVKFVSSIAMLGCAVVLFVVVRPLWAAATGTGAMAVVSAWIWRRPEGSARDAA